MLQIRSNFIHYNLTSDNVVLDIGGGGGALTYISDGVHKPMHQIKRPSVTIFLQKKGVIRCETAQNSGNFNTFLELEWTKVN